MTAPCAARHFNVNVPDTSGAVLLKVVRKYDVIIAEPAAVPVMAVLTAGSPNPNGAGPEAHVVSAYVAVFHVELGADAGLSHFQVAPKTRRD